MRTQVEGAHVLVRRGGCSFLAKALTVSNSGGRSLMVVDEGAGRLRMEADQGQDVGIPVVMVSKVDGEHVATTLCEEMLQITHMPCVLASQSHMILGYFQIFSHK